MAKQLPIELFMPPNMLKAKVGGTGGGIDLSMVKRAQAAMDSLKDNFSEWLAGDIERLVACRDAYVARPNVDTRKALYNASHNIKGQAATFEHPLIGRAATSMCKLMDECRGNALPVALVEGHIDAIHVFFRDDMKDAANPIANTLLNALEKSVAEVAAAYAARR
jgi:hypothetical protein